MEQQFHLAKSRQYKRYDKDQKFGFKEFCYGGPDVIPLSCHSDESQNLGNKIPARGPE
jgi:hypothetical protein